MKKATPEEFDLLLKLALELSASMHDHNRFEKMAESIAGALPVDAVTLLRLHEDVLVPVAHHGLSADAMGRRFPINQHPRLVRICEASRPVKFEANSPLPDPFDGLLDSAPSLKDTVHACLGCPLWISDQLIGVLALDALNPDAFQDISQPFLNALGAITGAALHNSVLLEALEKSAKQNGLIAQDLMHVERTRHGSYLIGASKVLEQLKEEIQLVGHSELPVLITGETGAGKELVVQMLHHASSRSDRPMVYLNCAALPETVAESELFGHAAGAFTDAKQMRQGKFQLADGGILFLDEIGELPPSVQAKLLRVLQFGEIQRVGSDSTVKINVRVFAATNRDLEQEVAQGRFRHDLLHRLDVCRLHVPALREHPEDIPAIAGHFCDQARRQLGSGRVHLTPQTQEALQSYPWPGNVRELQNVISRAALLAANRGESGAPVLLTIRDLGDNFLLSSKNVDIDPVSEATPTQTPPMQGTLKEQTDAFQKQVIQEAIARNNNNNAAAARDLGMHRSNFHRIVRRLLEND